ncbi:MAG TPA: alcohol dehydrogenase catalytic domain-containing protein [Acidimicrobiales bacterium]
MDAVVYHGPGEKAWEEVADPGIVDDTDALVRVDTVTICGTDLHILKGDVPAVTDGRVLGHEAVGTVEEVGPAVTTVAPGDRVLVSCISGADVAIEAVGVPDTFELCTRLIRPGGRVANIGVHGTPATLHLEDLWIRDVTITTGLVDTPRPRRCCGCSRATRSTPAGSSPTTSPSATSWRPTTCSPVPATRARSRWCCRGTAAESGGG